MFTVPKFFGLLIIIQLMIPVVLHLTRIFSFFVFVTGYQTDVTAFVLCAKLNLKCFKKLSIWITYVHGNKIMSYIT